jgi:hypothetical protein
MTQLFSVSGGILPERGAETVSSVPTVQTGSCTGW